jgi:hypothetical protein
VKRIATLLSTLLTAVALAGCGDSASTQEGSIAVSEIVEDSTRAANDVVVVVDLSDSITEEERTRQRTLLQELVEGLSYEHRLVVQIAHAAGVRSGIAPVIVEMPSARNPQRPFPREEIALNSARRSAAQAVAAVFTNGIVPSTDLIASMHTARNRFLPPDDRDQFLLILSDMLQCASGICFEKGGSSVPDASWTAQQRAQGTLPQLMGICVSVLGADPSTNHGARVREFWSQYFEAAGATFDADRYRHDVADVNGLWCE